MMQSQEPRWQIIEVIAPRLGVKPGTLKKWRKRGVPHRLRISFMQEAAGKLSAQDFGPLREDISARSAAE